MKKYTVKQLAKLSGTSVRTLHHYDEIRLLKPHKRSHAGYRVYGELELLKLQQILFFKELGYSLEEIRKILGDPGYDFTQSLMRQKTEMKAKAKRINTLLTTIDKTLNKLNQNTMLDDKELYEGLGENAKAYQKEAEEKWGDEVKKTEDRIRKMGKDKWAEVQKEGDMITQKLADLMDLEPRSPEVQEAISLWYKHLHHFYEVSEDRFRGLGQMYVQDDRFRAHYDKYRKGLADFINKAIQIFCDNGKAGN